MGTVPTPFDFAANAGNIPTAAILQAQIGDPLTFMISTKPRVFLRSAAAQSIPTGAFTALTFDTEPYDVNDPVTAASMHSIITNLSRITAQVAGTYQFSGSCSFTGNATGRRGLRWDVNGTTPVAGSQIIQAATTTGNVGIMAASVPISLGIGDYVELKAFQDSGGALATVVSIVESQPSVNAFWLAP